MGLYDDVADRLEQLGADEEVRGLALGALLGDDGLAGALEGDELRAPGGAREATDVSDHVRGVFLGEVEVSGFRGVGEPASLPLTPAPGLTLVIGRNGSGKSSFAEAIEVAFTGENARWAKRSKVWKDGWRNLHAGDAASIAIDLVYEGDGQPAQLRHEWSPTDDLPDGSTQIRQAGSRTDVASFNWAEATETFRPFLPYSELGSLVDEGPTKLHDALASVLGLSSLTDAAKRCKDARLERERAWKEVARDGTELAAELEQLDDPRAAKVVAQLRAKRPTLTVIEEMLAGSGASADPTLTTLNQLANLTAPDPREIGRLADGLREAAASAAAFAGTEPARDLRTAELLEAALGFHREHGDEECPVCGGGRLDQAWAEDARRRAEELRSTATEAGRIEAALARARADVRRAVTAPPAVLAGDQVAGVEVAGLLRAYEAWQQVLRHSDDAKQAEALVTAADDLAAGVGAVRGAAAREHERRQDAWRPFVGPLGGWLDDATVALAAAESVEPLRAAEKALSAVLEGVREERWAPIAAQAKQTWATLRQRSNVEIDEVALVGSGVKRRVDVSVNVDGVAGAALGVMSQGELHGLALSLFLPRATLTESPFRFLVIDDPVQSMDPARVDGLARVLESVAATRQVVVFTHDDRLPEAVRRLAIAATVIEVTRSTGSRVTTRAITSPMKLHLSDAHALARSSGLPELVRRRAVPSFLRLAIEAACADAVRVREIAKGRPHADVDDELARADKLLPLLSLTLFGDAAQAGDVYGRLNAFGGWAADAVRTVNEGTHKGASGDLEKLVKDVTDVIAKVTT